jgi:hypothetical protein
MQQHNHEFFLADEDINLNDKHKPDQEDVNSDDETVQISNISHVDVAHDDKCPIHPSSSHKWGECTHNPANKPIQWGSLTLPHCHNKLMPTKKMRCYLHRMTKLNYLDGTIAWGIFPSLC